MPVCGTESNEDKAALTEFVSDEDDCVKFVMRKPLGPEDGEFACCVGPGIRRNIRRHEYSRKQFRDGIA